jgi:threonine dehydrogenase-like Zn-dependent dehydrogenase
MSAAGAVQGMMHSAVIRRAGLSELTSVALAEPEAGEVRMAVEGCGVCGSDLPVWEGRPWFEYPREPGAPGHEGWGRVDAVGDGVTEVRVGDRIAALGYRSYADFELVPATRVVTLPPQLEGQPFPGEALGCAYNVFRRSGISAGDTVSVVGVGFLGAVVSGLAAAARARVVAISRRATAREMAGRMGAAHQLPVDDDTVAAVQELTGGEMCDIVIEAAGVQATLDLAGPLARTRGRLVIAGFHQDGPRTVDMQLWNWRGLDVINAHERDPEIYMAGMRGAVSAVADGRIDPRPLYTHSFPFDRLDDAFQMVRDRPEGFLKATVRR